MNIRHISLYNEFKLDATDNGTDYDFQNDRNINCIALNAGKNYSIKNLSIDIGGNTLESNNVYSVLTCPSFPLRFFLSENPINDCISNLYNLSSLIFDGVSNPSSFDYKQIDRLDSSNQSAYIAPIRYSNYLQLTEDKSGDGDYNYTSLKTNTLAEFNFFNFAQLFTLQSPGVGGVYSAFTSNNDINDFTFFSNTEQNLSIAIFPKLRIEKGIYANAVLKIKFNYTINFDLIEEN